MTVNSQRLLLAAAGAGGASGATDIALAHSNSPYLNVYPWDPDNGFGTKYANPSTLPKFQGDTVSWRTGGTDIAVVTNFSPFVWVYPWDEGFGTKYSDPSTLPPGDGFDVAFSPDGKRFASGSSDSTIKVYWLYPGDTPENMTNPVRNFLPPKKTEKYSSFFKRNYTKTHSP